jgi:hypothetical protein
MGEWKSLTPRGHGFNATRTTVQSIPTGTHTIILFNNEVFDTDNEYNTVDGKFTPQEAGYYIASANITIQNISDGKIYVIRLMKGGIPIAVDRGITGGNDRAGGCASCVVYLNGSTDYLVASFRHDEGAALDTEPGNGYCCFSAWLLAAP